MNALLPSIQSCCEETMRASVVLTFAVLALVFLAAYAADQVSDNNMCGYFACVYRANGNNTETILTIDLNKIHAQCDLF